MLHGYYESIWKRGNKYYISIISDKNKHLSYEFIIDKILYNWLLNKDNMKLKRVNYMCDKEHLYCIQF